MDLKVAECECLDWIKLAYSDYLTDGAITSLSRETSSLE